MSGGNPIAVVGDFLLDHVVDMSTIPEAVRAEWAEASWFPARGTAEQVDSIPEEVFEYIEATHPGGMAVNQAVAAAKAGGEVTLFTKTAGTTAHREAIDALESVGIDRTNVALRSGEGNECVVFRELSGEKRILAAIETGTDTTYLENICTTADFSRFSVILVTNSPPPAALAVLFEALEALEEPPTVIFDPAPVTGIETALPAPAIDIITPNDHEWSAIESKPLDGYTILRTHDRGVDIDGVRSIPAPQVDRVLDTTAAGDTFNGYLAARLARGDPLETAIRWGVVAGSLTVQTHGAQPSIPSSSAVSDAFDGFLARPKL